MNDIEQRLENNSSTERINALFDAFDLGIKGIELIIPALHDQDGQVQEAALLLLHDIIECFIYKLNDKEY
ncbi:MAG: hypothetical protein AAGE84_08065 [Cyanobacteria bacterium P01_G01_bin.39]